MTTVSIRELHTNLPKISELIALGETIVVEKYNKPFCRMVPFEEKKQKKYARSEVMMNLKFNGENALSQNMDEIIYPLSIEQ